MAWTGFYFIHKNTNRVCLYLRELDRITKTKAISVMWASFQFNVPSLKREKTFINSRLCCNLFGWGCSRSPKSIPKKIIIVSPQANMTYKNFCIDFFSLFALFFFSVCECILSSIFVWINWSVEPIRFELWMWERESRKCSDFSYWKWVG